MPRKTKVDQPVQLICGTCQKPISSKARSDVTRFLTAESRCVCPTPATDAAASTPGPDAADSTQSTPSAKSANLALLVGDPSISREEVQSNLGDRYEVLELIGQGGMGVVYKVHDKSLDKTFAIKVLNRNLVQDSNSVRRFEQEAQAASNLTHANLGAVYEYGVGKQGAPFIIMDFLDGENLAETLHRDGYFGVPRALDIFIQITEAVVHAHMKGVIHRDIKPGNVILTQAGGGGQDFAKLVDFGIAKVLPTQEATSKLTQTGEIFGSPLYMSPEQCLGNPLDARSDIYALGCVMYEVLTNVPAFAADNSIKTIFKQVNDPPTPFAKLHEHHYAIPANLETVVLRCLEKDPADRYQSAQGLLSDLLSLRDGKKIAPAPRKKKRLADAREDTGGTKVRRIVGIIISICVTFYLAYSFVSLNAGGGLNGPVLTGQAHSDADELDRWSKIYFERGDFERAIPLLEFGLKTYKEGGKHYDNPGTETVYLGDNYNHLGKCYLALNQPAKAVDYYRNALRLYNKFGDYNGSNMPEAVKDYATVLRKLGRDADAAKMVQQFAQTKRVADIP